MNNRAYPLLLGLGLCLLGLPACEPPSVDLADLPAVVPPHGEEGHPEEEIKAQHFLLAVLYKNTPRIRALLEDEGVDVNTLFQGWGEAPCPEECTALWVAVGVGDREMVALLLGYGADSDLPLNDTAYTLAQDLGREDIVELFRRQSPGQNLGEFPLSW